MRAKKALKVSALILMIVVAVSVVVCAVCFVLQKYYAHRSAPFIPDYERLSLTESTDYETIFLQTGIGRAAAEKLISEGEFDKILKAQEVFFTKADSVCNPLIGWFTREDRLSHSKNTPFYDLQAGDIIVSISTHSGGWRHGHGGLVISNATTLESLRMGKTSSLEDISYWRKYPTYAVLRVKDKTAEERQAVADFALDNLHDRPYKLLSGVFGEKAPSYKNDNFGLHCTYLMWYAWQNAGIDLDSDGGRFVTCHDLLHSDKVEVVQLYGLDPRDFI